MAGGAVVPGSFVLVRILSSLKVRCLMTVSVGWSFFQFPPGLEKSLEF